MVQLRVDDTEREKESRAILKFPYSAWTAEEILAYFQRRTDISYFPVLDDEETKRDKIDGVLRNCFVFNGEEYHLPACFDWTDNPSQDEEWLIMLHKFYYAVGLGAFYHKTGDERYAAKWLELTGSWIDSVPLDFLTSDVTGRRVQNWIFAHHYFVTRARTPLLSPAFYLKFLASLHNQVCYLYQNLTPARNHRTIELCAIFLAAVVFPEFNDAEHWLAFARQELLKNMQSDLLPDGVQYELSTDYHHVVLKNYLNTRRLAFLNHIPMPAAMDEHLQRALEFAMYAHKPDGFIPSLSDGDSGTFLRLLQQGYELYGAKDLLYAATQGRQGRPPAQRSRSFRDSGYIILRSGWGEGGEAYGEERYLIFDCGPLGVGNHGHLDLLSFEMAAYGRSLIVDPGRYTYEESGEINWRALFRGTGYHNTVQVDKKNQTRYVFHKNRFRIQGPEPERELKAFVTRSDYDYVHGIARSHEYSAVHERKLFFPWLEYWILTDLLRAAETHHYELLFHLAPEAWQQVVTEVVDETRLVHAPHLVIAQPYEAQVQLFVEQGYVSPSYGVKHTAPIVRFARQAADAAYHTILYPYRAEKPRLAVAVLPVRHNNQHCPPWQALALSITITRDRQRYIDTYFNSTAPDPVAHYRFGDFTYNGSLLCVRQDEDGRILRVQGQPGTLIHAGGQPIAVR